MTKNDALVKLNFISKMLVTSGDAKLDSDLKVKIIKLRIKLDKIRKEYDADVQEFTNQLITDDFKELQMKADRTEEEEAKVKEMADQINGDYAKYVKDQLAEEVEIGDASFTEDEFAQIVEVNADNDVEINGQKLSSADFLVAIHDIFVEE